jgi:hypothetical protein
MAAIKLSTGEVLISAATRDQIVTALAGTTGVATGQINGVATTVRSGHVIAVADTIEGLRGQIVAPLADPTIAPNG